MGCRAKKKRNFTHLYKHDGCLYGQLEVKQNIVYMPTAFRATVKHTPCLINSDFILIFRPHQFYKYLHSSTYILRDIQLFKGIFFYDK